MKKQVRQLREWRRSVESKMEASATKSLFDEWLEQFFKPVKSDCPALSQSEFDNFVARMEETEASCVHGTPRSPPSG